jgi:hypothetical protein
MTLLYNVTFRKNTARENYQLLKLKEKDQIHSTVNLLEKESDYYNQTMTFQNE